MSVEQKLLSDLLDVARVSNCSLLEVELARLQPANEKVHATHSGLLAIDGKIERWGYTNAPDAHEITEYLTQYAAKFPSFLLFDDFFRRTDPLVRPIATGADQMQLARPPMLEIKKHDPVETKWRNEWDTAAATPDAFLHSAWESWVETIGQRWRQRDNYNLSCIAIGARFEPFGNLSACGPIDPLKHSAAIFATVSHGARTEDVSLLYYRAQAHLYSYLGGQLMEMLETSRRKAQELFTEGAEKQQELDKLRGELEANLNATRRMLDEERERWGLTDEMRDDLKELLNAVATARGRALKIESRMDKSKQSFLRLYAELRLLFIVEGTILVTKDHANKTILHTSSEAVHPEHDVWPLDTIHSSADKKLQERWPLYVKLLYQYNETIDIDLLGWFNKQDPNTYARQFNLLKLLLQRIHLRNEGLFPVQLLAASLMAVQNHAAVVTVEAESFAAERGVRFQFTKERDIDVTNLVNLLTLNPTLGPWLEPEGQPERGVLAGTTTPSSVIGAIMSLLGNEIRSKTAADMTATAEAISIRETETQIEFNVVCRGALDQPDKLKDLSQGNDRSLRSVLKTICESVNQQQLLLVDTADVEEVRNIRRRLRDPQCIVGVDPSGDGRTIFSIAWRRERIK